MEAYDEIYIAKNNHYELKVSRLKNSAELYLKGYWDENAQMEYYMEDVKKATSMLSSGFTFLVDLSEFTGCIPCYLQKTIEAQKHLVNCGLGVTAEVLPQNPMLKPIAELLSKESGMNTVYFNNRASALRFLALY